MRPIHDEENRDDPEVDSPVAIAKIHEVCCRARPPLARVRKEDRRGALKACVAVTPRRKVEKSVPTKNAPRDPSAKSVSGEEEERARGGRTHQKRP